MKSPRPFFLLLTAALLPGALCAEPLEEGWEMAASLLFNDANKVFEKAAPSPELKERERTLGVAVTLLNVQPRLQSNLNRARELFGNLAANEEDDIAVDASYFLARMDAFYEAEPRLDEARSLYRSLIERHPGHLLAEYGVSQWVLMDLYDDIPPAKRAERFLDLETIGAQLQTVAGRRSYHLNMGNAYIDFDSETADSRSHAIRHLLAADAEGFTRWQVEAETWIAIGELARSEDRTELAKTYYEKFLAKYQRDNRHHTIRERLETLADGSRGGAD